MPTSDTNIDASSESVHARSKNMLGKHYASTIENIYASPENLYASSETIISASTIENIYASSENINLYYAICSLKVRPHQALRHPALCRAAIWNLGQVYLSRLRVFIPRPKGKGDSSRARILSSCWRPASGVTFSCERKNSKTTCQFFLKFYHDISRSMGMCKWRFKDATKFNMAARCQLQFFLSAQIFLKLNVRNY